MSRWYASRAQLNTIDRLAVSEYGMNSLQLMENAGSHAADEIARRSPTGAVHIFAGTGNNAGDGYVIARHLDFSGRDVHIWQLISPENLKTDALANYYVIERSQLRIHLVNHREELAQQLPQISPGSVLVDAMLGTGAKGAPREPIATAIRHANMLDCVRVAIDIPTGLDCDSGATAGEVFMADYTCTFVTSKQAFAQEVSKKYTGQVVVFPIGIPRVLLQHVQRIV